METSEFDGYEKMPSSLKKLNLSPEDFSKFDQHQWIVTEKIHGANFSFVYENNRLKFSKRKAYLDWDSDFFGFQLVVKRIEDKVWSLFEKLNAGLEAEKLIIYGELFGGAYPHPSVKNRAEVQAIQTGVYYSPNIHFCAFDVAIVPFEKPKYYLDYQSASLLFESFGLLYAKPLFLGKLNTALSFDTRINSTIPALLDLPSITENLIEGIVIKPFDVRSKSVGRPIFKIKNKEFEEQKYHQSQKWSFTCKISAHSIEINFLLEELRNYVTANRLASAVSKIGAIDHGSKERTAAIETEFLLDALSDFNLDNAGILDELTVEQITWLKKRLLPEIRTIMQQKSADQ